MSNFGDIKRTQSKHIDILIIQIYAYEAWHKSAFIQRIIIYFPILWLIWELGNRILISNDLSKYILVIIEVPHNIKFQWPLLLTWFNFNPCMD